MYEQGNRASGGVKTSFVSENRAPGSDSKYAVDYRASGSVRGSFVSESRASGIDSSYAVDYRASESIRDPEYGYSEAKINTANIQKLPSNHQALLASFPPSEQLKIIELLKLHSNYLSYDILLAMDKNDFSKILKALLSSFSSHDKYLFLPFHLPNNSQVALKSGDNCKVTLLTTTFIDIPASSHIYLNLDLQLLCRSTFVQLKPVMTDGTLFIEKLSSISVMAKHQFKSVFIHNVNHYNIRIPKNYTLFVIEGLTHLPTNSGNILKLRNLQSIVDLQSEKKNIHTSRKPIIFR